MKLKFYLLTALLALTFVYNAQAQTTCEYRLEMYDSFGDGWNGANIDVNNGGTVTNYTVNFADNNGDFNIVDILVTDGEELTLTYTGGTFENEVTYFLYDSEDNIVFQDGPFPAVGLVFETTTSCPTCPTLDDEIYEFTALPGGFTIDFAEGQLPGDYLIEYGPLNFEPGTGTTVTANTNTFTIDDLPEGEYYHIYISLDCGGGDISNPAGPFLAQAGFINPPLECFYTLEMYDSFGDGWNGAQLSIQTGIFTNVYTVTNNDNNGDFLFVDIPVVDGDLFTVTYSGGTFDNEVTYFIYDSDGNEVFSDGPNPPDGLVFEGFSVCPTCPGIFEETVEYTQTPDGAIVTWEEGQVDGDYIVEYGPFGFEPGTGTTETVSDNSITLTGFDEGTVLQVYITLDCGDGDISSPTDPIFVQTGFTEPPLECLYTLQLFAANGFGWGAANIDVIINDGDPMNYTVAFNDNDGDFNFVSFPVTSGSLLTLDYNADNFDADNSFILLDADGLIVYESPLDPEDGINFQDIVSCPACPLPLPDSYTIEPLEATTATINWSEVSSVETFTVLYGENCFDPETEGETVMTNTNSVDLTGLEPGTLYTYYLTGDCGADGLSSTGGPYFFQTPPVCFPPTAAGVDFVGSNAATISFTPDPNVGEYIFEYGPAGFAPGGGIQTGLISGMTGDLQNLVANTDYDVYIYGSCGGGLSAPFGPVSFSTVLPCAAPTEFILGEVTDASVSFSWDAVPAAVSYTVEYGPLGFEQGTGATVTTSTNEITLTEINPAVQYEVYISSSCGADGESLPFGPFTVVLPGEGSCTFTLEMFDSFGDGWNGANIVIDDGTNQTTYTVNFADNNGDFNIVEFEVFSGSPITLTYSPGTFENEVTYFLYDNNGNLLFEDGPFPEVGLVYTGFAQCGDCAAFGLEVSNITSTTADVTFSGTDNAVSYVVEWGPVGFLIGSGTSGITTDTTFTLTGLTPDTDYNVYVTPDCAAPDEPVSSGGPAAFTTYLVNDVGISGFASPTVIDCVTDLENLPISVFIQNYGDAPQQLIPFFYSFNFVDESIENPVDGLFTGVVSKDSMEVIDFDNEQVFPGPGYYLFQAWTELEGDENPANDTFTYEFITAYPLPLFEDFNDVTDETGFADGWSSPNGVPVLEPGEIPHGLTSNVFGEFISDNFNGIDTIELTTARYGPMQSDSELSFDYRFVRTSGDGTVIPYILDGDDYLRVDVSNDCGETFEELIVIQGNDFTTTFFKNVTVSLAEYEDEALSFRFQASNSLSGDFFVDVDNINVAGCPENLFLQIDQSDPASFATGNGSLFVRPTFGLAPFTFEWSDGQTTALAEGLGFTAYSVTVTDAQGCTSERVFSPTLTDTEEVPFADFAALQLAPNPTAGTAQLAVTLDEARDAEVRIYDLTGRHLRTYSQQNVQSTTFNLDLQDAPDGMYLVRVQAGNAVKVLKLAVAR